MLVGSNTAWCHPILLQRLLAARERRPRMKIVALDPRRTATTQLADLHLPLAAGTDVHLFNGLLVWLEEHGRVDRAFVEAHTQWLGSRRWQAARAGGGSLEATARACGLDVDAAAAVLRNVCSDAGRDHGVLAGREPELRRAPTRSTPSSTVTSPPGASASRAPGRSRSPASPMPWVAARWAASSTRWPRTSTSRTRPAGRRCSEFWGSPDDRRRARVRRPWRCSTASTTAASRPCGSWRPTR